MSINKSAKEKPNKSLSKQISINSSRSSIFLTGKKVDKTSSIIDRQFPLQKIAATFDNNSISNSKLPQLCCSPEKLEIRSFNEILKRKSKTSIILNLNEKALDNVYKDRQVRRRIKKIKSVQNKYDLKEYQMKLLDIIKNNISNENLRFLGIKLREISKQCEEYGYSKKRKSRWQETVKRISPYLPEFLVEKFESM